MAPQGPAGSLQQRIKVLQVLGVPRAVPQDGEWGPAMVHVPGLQGTWWGGCSQQGSVARRTTELPQGPSWWAGPALVLWWPLGSPRGMLSHGGGCLWVPQWCACGLDTPAVFTWQGANPGKSEAVWEGVGDALEGSIKSRVLRWRVRPLRSLRALPVPVLR